MEPEKLPEPLNDPWLIAVWPGMGAVAQIAGTYLTQALGGKPVAELPPGDSFDVTSIRVKSGLVEHVPPARTVFHAWRNPEPGGRDLLVAIGDRQPNQRGYEFCGRLLDGAARFGVKRVFTFAAMAAPILPEADSHVSAVATSKDLLAEAREAGARPLRDGEVTGLNGVLLAAAAARHLDAICLLGEFPYFATTIPNPKASRAVLRVFTDLAAIDLDFEALDAQVESIEHQLVDLLARIQEEQGSDTSLGVDREFPLDDEEDDEEEELQMKKKAAAKSKEKPIVLPADVEARIEALFEAAQKDRAKALELKAELDRHGVFKRYEDRFLDMFRQAG